ncbi:unnamed protein product [Closterium sp. NIES-53]
MHSRFLVSGLPRSLPPLPPCLPCVEGRQRSAPHSSSFPPTTAPLQTLHMDVWGPARVSGQGRERYFLLVVDDYTRFTTFSLLRSKGEVPEVVIPWIRTDFCRGEGILQSFTLPESPQQNGIAERRIGLVMEVARTSMIHAVAPHFLPRPQCVPGAAPGAASWGAASGGAEPGGAGSEGAGSWGAESGGAELERVEPGGAESEGAESMGAEPQGAALSGGPAGASPRLSSQLLPTGAGGAAVPAGASGTGGAAATGPGGARTSGAGAGGTCGVGCAGAGDSTDPGAAGAGGAGAGGAGGGGPGAGGAGGAGVGVGGTGAGGARPAGAGAVDPGAGGAGGTVRPRLYFDGRLVVHPKDSWRPGVQLPEFCKEEAKAMPLLAGFGCRHVL